MVRSFMPGTADGEVLAFKEQAAVDFIREYENIAITMILATCSMSLRGMTPPVGFVENENNELGAIMISAAARYIQREISSSRSWMGTALPPVVDHRLVDGEARIGVDDLIASSIIARMA